MVPETTDPIRKPIYQGFDPKQRLLVQPLHPTAAPVAAPLADATPSNGTPVTPRRSPTRAVTDTVLGPATTLSSSVVSETKEAIAGLKGTAQGVKDQASLLADRVGQLATDVVHLIDLKTDLFKLELKEGVARAAKHVAMLVVGGVLALLGVMFLLVAAAFGIGALLGSTGWGFLVVGGVLAVGGGVLAFANRHVANDYLGLTVSKVEQEKDKRWLKQDL